MFHPQITVEKANDLVKNSIINYIGIIFTEINDRHIKATMPVDSRTQQPFGLLHGGASVVLAETLGSFASLSITNPETESSVGLEVNANHIKSVKEGFVEGTVTPIHIGKKTHVWEIKINDEEGSLVCISRLTVAIINKK